MKGDRGRINGVSAVSVSVRTVPFLRLLVNQCLSVYGKKRAKIREKLLFCHAVFALFGRSVTIEPLWKAIIPRKLSQNGSRSG